MANLIKAIIFDVDGTIADTERYGHLPASNDAMRELGLDIVWGWEEYKVWINTIPGNVNRLVYTLDNLGYSAKEIERYACDFAPLKKSIYINRYLPNLKIRAGVKAMIQEAVDARIRLGIVSTSYESQIKALLESQLSEFYPFFDPILGKESGRKTNNDGYLHKLCLAKMGVQPEEAIVIEDAASGLSAALCAGIPTAIFYNDYTKNDAFDGAALVAPSMADYNLDRLITAMICKQH